MVRWSDLDVLGSLVLSSCKSLFDSGPCNSFSIPQCMLNSLIILNMTVLSAVPVTVETGLKILADWF